MKKVIKRILTLAFVLVLSMGMTGCVLTDAREIKETLTEFQQACRDLDVETMLDCIDPDVSDQIRMGLALVSVFTDIDYDEVIAGVFDNVDSNETSENFDAEDFLDSISVSKVKLKIKSPDATVNCHITYQIAEEEFETDATIEMVKKDDKWYISDIDMD